MEQNQSSAPWLHPPNTLCNTDGWRRTRKSTSKITVRSAKKQERLKKTWNAKPKCYWVWPRDALAPFPPDPGCDPTDRPLCRLPGLFPPSRLPHLFHLPGGRRAPQTSLWPADLSEPGEVGAAVVFGGSAEGRVCVLVLKLSLQLSEGREHRHDVLVIIMAPAVMFVVQSLCCVFFFFFYPSARVKSNHL